MGRFALKLAGSALFAALLATPLARAQNTSVLAAEAKFSEGVRLMKADQCEPALDRFRESQALDPASGTLLDIGYCEARLGKTASAWLAYRQALALAQSSSRSQHERIARKEIDRLEPELPFLSLELTRDSASSVSVELDGAELPRAVWSVATPVDPGTHSVRVLVRGELKWEESFSIAARERRSVDVPLSALSTPEPKPAPSVQVVSESPPPERRSTPLAIRAPSTTEPAQRSGTATAVALASAGVGTVGLVAAGVLFAGARHDYDEVDSDCPGNVCQSQQSYDLRRAAIRRFHWSLGVGGGGIALLGVAAAVWFGSSPRREMKTSNVMVDIERHRVGVSWRARF
ncbi:MAG: hypothetical protein ACOY0T_33945 [Myxococcota bacterium]